MIDYKRGEFMLSYFVGIVGVLVALIGWFGYSSLNALIVGTVLYLIETIMEWKSLNIAAKIVDVVVFAIGAIIALFVDAQFYVGGMIAINIYSVLIILVTLPEIISRISLLIRFLSSK